MGGRKGATSTPVEVLCVCGVALDVDAPRCQSRLAGLYFLFESVCCDRANYIYICKRVHVYIKFYTFMYTVYIHIYAYICTRIYIYI